MNLNFNEGNEGNEENVEYFSSNSPALTNNILNENVNNPLTNGNEITGGPSVSNLNVPQGLDNEDDYAVFDEANNAPKNNDKNNNGRNANELLDENNAKQPA